MPVRINSCQPSARLLTNQLNGSKAPTAKTLTTEEADLNLGLIEPTAMLGSVVNSEAAPNVSTPLFTIMIDQGLAAVNVEVVQDKVDGQRPRISVDQPFDRTSKVCREPAFCWPSEVSAGQGFHGAEHISGSTTLVFSIALRDASRLRRHRRANFVMQHQRFLVESDDGLGGTVGTLVQSQNILHAGYIVVSQLRDAPHFFPPRSETAAL